MNGNKHYWRVLIDYWVKVKRRNGLTIPFIIGAKVFIKEQTKASDIEVKDLFRQLIDDPTDEVFTLQHCENVGEYVIGLNSINRRDGIVFKNLMTEKPKLIATLNTSVLGKSIDAIIISLTKRYSSCIAEANYSRINREWAPFSEEDIKMINVAFGSQGD